MIIDTHTHFYDPTRPQGVPWPSAEDEFLYRRILPADYRKEAGPEGVTGTIIVEASAWVEDNQWLLDLAVHDSFILGLVGHLRPSSEDFEQNLKRFAANPMFLGLRLGVGARDDAGYAAALEQLVAHDLELDLGAYPASMGDVAFWAARFPKLRIVLNHLVHVAVTGGMPDPVWIEGLRPLQQHANVFCKVSALVELAEVRPAPADLAYYTPTLDALWNSFGEERLVYGSNWPVSQRFASYAAVQGLAWRYFEKKGVHVLERVFWKNSLAAYKWPNCG